MTWQKGESGNPYGRPRKGQSIREKLETELSKGNPENLDQIVKALVEQARAGDLNAIKILFDRLEGRPPQLVVTEQVARDELIEI